MTTYSSILVWGIPWTEKPGGLQTMGSQKSWTELSDWTTNYIHIYYIYVSKTCFSRINQAFFCLIGKTFFHYFLIPLLPSYLTSELQLAVVNTSLLESSVLETSHTSFHMGMERFNCLEWAVWSVCLPIFFQRIKEYLLGSECKRECKARM